MNHGLDLRIPPTSDDADGWLLRLPIIIACRAMVSVTSSPESAMSGHLPVDQQRLVIHLPRTVPSRLFITI
ncbi:hypothetical protein [Sphingobium arseniciresistens]|uniref:hypothetical protein n=1 Tax=Sphingobium arseniciresistens TaxID=3030834 RepID=UPI0023B94976